MALLNDQSVCIDFKRGLAECCVDLCQQHDRFKRELIRAQEAEIRLIILTEQYGVKTLDDVKKWVNPRLKVSPYAVSGEKLARMMDTMARKYGVEWVFCDKRVAGKMTEEILCSKN